MSARGKNSKDTENRHKNDDDRALAATTDDTQNTEENTVVIDDQDKTVASSSPESSSSSKSSSPTTFSSGPKEGELFANHFEIINLLGRGGMSKVYKARDTRLDRIVALKTLLPHLLENDESVKRFQREAQSIGDIKHSGVVQVYEFNIANQTPYIVMEYLEGEDLGSIIETEKVLSYERAVPIFIKICDALKTAHGKGVIHRDLKPSNVLVIEQDGEKDIVGVVDFGLAKFMPHANKDVKSLTATGQIFGSPPYMSPEQCQGESLDERADIYSMGCLMYETLTGKPPLIGETPVATVMKQMTEEPRPPGRLAEVPPKMEAIILKALRKNPDTRQQSMNELYDELKEFAHLQNIGMEYKPVGISTQILRLNNRIPKKYLIIGVIVTLWLISRWMDPGDGDIDAKVFQTQLIVSVFLILTGTLWYFNRKFKIENVRDEIDNLNWMEDSSESPGQIAVIEENINSIVDRINAGNLDNPEEQILLLRKNLSQLVESPNFKIPEESLPEAELKLADSLFELKRYSDAQTIYSECLLAQSKQYSSDSLRISKLGDCYLNMGNFKHAEESYENALSLYNSLDEKEINTSSQTNQSIAFLKYAYTSASRYKPIKLDPKFEQAVNRIKDSFGEGSSQYSTALNLYACYLWKEKKFFSALDHYKESRRITRMVS